MRISDWSSDVCSSDLAVIVDPRAAGAGESDRGQEEPVLVALQRRRWRVQHAQAVVHAPAAVQVQVALPQRHQAAESVVVAVESGEALAVAVEQRRVERERAPGRGLAKAADRNALLVEAVVDRKSTRLNSSH